MERAEPRPVEDDFRALYRGTVRQVHRRLQLLTGAGDHVEDLVQQTYLELHRSLPKFRRECRLSTFLTRISINVALQYRRTSKRKPPPDVSLSEVELVDATDHESRMMAHRAMEVVMTLPDDLRIPFILYELEEQTFEEIAAAINVSLSTVHGRVKKAKKKLLAELERKR